MWCNLRDYGTLSQSCRGDKPRLSCHHTFDKVIILVGNFHLEMALVGARSGGFGGYESKCIGSALIAGGGNYIVHQTLSVVIEQALFSQVLGLYGRHR